MTVKEVAGRLRVSDGLVRDEIRRGHLQASKVGSLYLACLASASLAVCMYCKRDELFE